eukprot:12757991-Alexandrium_andersonii.AAC.1
MTARTVIVAFSARGSHSKCGKSPTYDVAIKPNNRVMIKRRASLARQKLWTAARAPNGGAVE